jgi:hypothetical protein
MICYAMLCYAMLCYAMLCYAMLCYAMLLPRLYKDVHYSALEEPYTSALKRLNGSIRIMALERLPSIRYALREKKRTWKINFGQIKRRWQGMEWNSLSCAHKKIKYMSTSSASAMHVHLHNQAFSSNRKTIWLYSLAAMSMVTKFLLSHT